METAESTTLLFRLSIDLHSWLKNYSQHQGVTMTDLINNQLLQLRQKDLERVGKIVRAELQELQRRVEIK